MDTLAPPIPLDRLAGLKPSAAFAEPEVRGDVRIHDRFEHLLDRLADGGDRGSRTLVIARQEYGPRDRFSASITRSWIDYCSFLNKS
jgi:hypothetical protein